MRTLVGMQTMLRGVGNSMGIGRNWYKIIEQTHRTRQPEGCGRRYVPLPWEPWGDSAKAPLRLDCAQAQPPRVRMYVLHPIYVCVRECHADTACIYMRVFAKAPPGLVYIPDLQGVHTVRFFLACVTRFLSTIHNCRRTIAKISYILWKISLAFSFVRFRVEFFSSSHHGHYNEIIV